MDSIFQRKKLQSPMAKGVGTGRHRELGTSIIAIALSEKIYILRQVFFFEIKKETGEDAMCITPA